MRIRLTPLATSLAAFLLACGGGSEGGSGTGPATPVVTAIIVTPSSSQLDMGGTTTLSVDVRDQSGKVMTGKSVTWSSSNTAVATVDNGGVVKGLAAGTATIGATVDSKTGTATVTVIPAPVASVAISGASGSVVAGQTVNLSVVLKDRNANVLSGRSVTWTSSNTRVGTIDANGVVSALSAGTTTITATSEAISATLDLTVTPPAGSVPPTVSSVSPATLTPGVTATITGSNFGTTTALNGVYINGVQAVVTAASPTQLSVTVPPALPCQATQAVNVDVVTVAGTATKKQPLQVATARPLAVGASFMVNTPDQLGCNELPNSGTYLVSVFNASPAYNQISNVELKGAVSGVAADGPAALTASRLLVPATRTVSNPLTAAERAAAHEHILRLQQAAETFRQFRKSRIPGAQLSLGAPGSGVPAATRATAPVPLTVGATASINFNYSGCGTSATKPVITARVVYVGSKAVVLEDNAAPLAGKIDPDLIAMAKDFEDVSFPILTTNFGNPLAWDDSTDRNGRIIMMFTPQVNNQGSNLLGFVQPCDLLSVRHGSSFAASNSAEIFYARAVTDTSPTATSLNSRTGWKRQMPATIIHETKHIVSFAERFMTPVLINEYEETWIEEATAQLAAEMYGRAIHGNGFKTDAKYVGTVDKEVCKVSICDTYTIVMRNHFGWLEDFLQNFETKTIIRDSGDGSTDDDMYGSSWLFTRWLADTYAANEASFIKSMVLNYNVVGVNNVTSLTGKTFAQLLSQFTLMLAADNIAGVPAQYQEASWNLPDIYAGLNADFPPSTYPLSPLAIRQSVFSSNFTAQGSLKGGGALLVKLTAPTGAGTQLLDLHGTGGFPLSSTSNVGIAVLRIQ